MANGFSQNTCLPASSAARVSCSVGRRGSRDDDHLDTRVGEQVGRGVVHRRVVPRGELGRSGVVAVGDGAQPHVGEVGDGVDEERGEPSRADETEPEGRDHPLMPELSEDAVKWRWNAMNRSTAGAARTTAPASIAPNGLVARPATLLM